MVETTLRNNSSIGKVESIREKVFYTLRNLILYSELKPGERLVESQLAELLGVSTTPVREALQKLVQEGLVEIYPRRHYIVRGISWEDAVEIVRIRASLEIIVIEKVIEIINEDILKELEASLDLSKRYIESFDIDNLCKANDSFHKILIKHANSARLDLMLKNFSDYIVRFRKISLSQPGRAQDVFKDHSNIFESLKNGDVEKAVLYTKEHIWGIIPFLSGNLASENEL